MTTEDGAALKIAKNIKAELQGKTNIKDWQDDVELVFSTKKDWSEALVAEVSHLTRNRSEIIKQSRAVLLLTLAREIRETEKHRSNPHETLNQLKMNLL